MVFGQPQVELHFVFLMSGCMSMSGRLATPSGKIKKRHWQTEMHPGNPAETRRGL